MTWEAETIHGVIFQTPSGQTPDALQPWLRLFKSSPQSFQANPVGAPLGGTASGLVGSYNVIVVAQSGRLELILAAQPVPDGPPQNMRDMEQALATLLVYLKTLLPDTSPVRVAIVANLARRTKDMLEATGLFSADTGLRQTIPHDAQDLSFALNVRKISADSSRQLNRLCRWGTALQQYVQLKITSGMGEPSLGVQEFPAETLQIDVNSAPSAAPFTVPEASAILDEIAEEVKSLMKDGYAYLSA
jgi:hypothetical protein